MQATVRAPGSCGELVQGSINGQNFLVTCPINLYSYVTVRLTKQSSRINCKQGLNKTIQAVEKTLTFFNRCDLGAQIEVNSELIAGKGMASSTADITAAILATTIALSERITLEQIAQLALSIEPTDGTFYEGIVLFDHLTGQKYEYLGQISGLDILVLDLGGRINTLDFNSREDLGELNELNEPLTRRALQLVKRGIQQNNLQLIGQGATLSSKANQVILAKRNFGQLLELTALQGVVGINVAHSGTLVGVLYNATRIESEDLQLKVKEIVENVQIYDLSLINGGLEVVASGKEQRYGKSKQNSRWKYQSSS
ncbi:GHMP family kinase ATP-binding protein [Fuchsiella alkaliacetigena]|uniref:GHMP family kinase ATP-binding protein n=1 Tax=Fuchsiella alkaliacetigena TaxID=957042 RepID=UPI00200AFA16|nr:kinase [Fuchsiella alkaliacetigena]MCK8825514.1 kinase [Fuchsiella alkaliacetigena]